MNFFTIPGVPAFPYAAARAALEVQVRELRPVWLPGELESMLAHLVVGCALAVAVFRLVPRVAWPRPMRWQFIFFHVLAAPAATALWLLITLPIESLVGGKAEIGVVQRSKEMLLIGSFFYFLIAGLAYSSHGASRAAKAEAVVAQSQLATLRSQLQPHFLFNALHTVVQLIHIEPRRAAEAAELVAELLRRALEEQRDEVPLEDEWRFVSRYLAVEQIRFGDRLVTTTSLPANLMSERLPSFALQTLVENAVQHGVSPRVEPTEVAIVASANDAHLRIAVRNIGSVDSAIPNSNGTGTGIARLRARLSALYGPNATLAATHIASGGYEAVLTVPRSRGTVA